MGLSVMVRDLNDIRMREQYLYAANYGIMAQSGMNVGAAGEAG